MRHHRSKRAWRRTLVLAAVLVGLGGSALAQRWRGDRGGGPRGEEARGAWSGDRHGERAAAPNWERHGEDARRPGGWGEPPEDRPDTRDPAWRPDLGQTWRRGSYLPPGYRGEAMGDYASHRLRRPPEGYHWVRMGDRYLLVSSSTGLVFDVVRGP